MVQVPVHVAFAYRKERWTHDFDLPKGSTVLQLKEKMLKGGSKEDIDSAELQKHGRRVPDYEPINQETTLDFFLLWPEEGARKAKEDITNRGKSDGPKVLEAPEPQKPQAPAKEIEVTIRHAVEDMASEVRVTVMSDCTIVDVRRAVMEKLGESKLSEVKIVKKVGTSFSTMSNEEAIGDRRELFSMGRRLDNQTAAPAPAPEPEPPAPTPTPAPAPEPVAEAAPPSPPKELTVVVTIERSLGMTTDLMATEGSTIYSLKEQIAAQDPTGGTQPDQFSLGISPADDSEAPVPLPDETPLTEQLLALDIIMAF